MSDRLGLVDGDVINLIYMSCTLPRLKLRDTSKYRHCIITVQLFDGIIALLSYYTFTRMSFTQGEGILFLNSWIGVVCNYSLKSLMSGHCGATSGPLWTSISPEKPNVLYDFEYKTWYILYRAHTWHFDISARYPQGFHRFKFFMIPPCFIKQQYLWNNAIQPAVGCSDLWADIHCSGYSPLGKK